MIKLMPKLKIKKAFTLIELLVVIAIIGVLATFIVASFTSAQQKSRDSRRKSDLDAIKKALELARGDSQGGTFYPGCAAGTSCNIVAAPVGATTNDGSTFNPDISPAYIRAVPIDPSNVANNYVYNPGCTGSFCATTFTLKACLENTADPQAGASGTAPCAATQRDYTVNSN